MRIVRLLTLIASLLGASLPAAVAPAPASEAFQAALTLFNAHRYPEARAALEKIVAEDPLDAAAHHYLGRAIAARNDNAAYEEALPHLAKAAELDPNNAAYLGVYGGTSLQYASRTSSFSAATKGRDAMEKALKIDPDYLNAREGLYQFYDRAPWPLGSSSKAAAQLEEIRKRDPDLATVLAVQTKTKANDFAAAFKLCEQVLGKKPDDYTALYYYGRTAALAGQNLEAGLQSLEKCLKMEPPSPASPAHTHVWRWIGMIQERQNKPEDARRAFETALKLDPSNRGAIDALAKYKSGGNG